MRRPCRCCCCCRALLLLLWLPLPLLPLRLLLLRLLLGERRSRAARAARPWASRQLAGGLLLLQLLLLLGRRPRHLKDRPRRRAALQLRWREGKGGAVPAKVDADGRRRCLLGGVGVEGDGGVPGAFGQVGVRLALQGRRGRGGKQARIKRQCSPVHCSFQSLTRAVDAGHVALLLLLHPAAADAAAALRLLLLVRLAQPPPAAAR